MASRNCAFGCHDSRCRLRQPQSIEQPAEAGLAVRGAVALETRQRQPDAILQPLLRAREQKSLLVNRQQHIERPRRQQRLDEPEKAGRIVAQSRAAMKPVDEPREPRQAIGAGIADLDEVA